MKILVLGSTGMLGWMVQRVLSSDPQCKVVGTHNDRTKAAGYFDVLSDIQTLESLLSGVEYVINCIGITKNLIDEQNPQSVERAIEINTKFPHRLGEIAGKVGARVIQISTNGVFSGTYPSYVESDAPDATDIYGKTKAQGEVQQDNFLNIRCSIIGPSPIKKGGLFEWFRSQSDGAVISGYTNHQWNGVTTLQFAQLCKQIVIGDHFKALCEQSPVYHFVPNSSISKYELLTLFQSALGTSITINPAEDPRGGGSSPILITQLQILKQIFPNTQSLDQAIYDLCAFSGTSSS
ncbi:SDR family oxidoreductase [Candidatus Uhrbacteria bacterium]|nr:SDR family oxidoreductase [Candidatus Uhrbacteria bacterium]